MEQALAHIWQEALGLDHIGVQDDFFELGGNSLTAVQVIAEMRKRLGVRLSVRELFASPTIARLAGTLGAATGAGTDSIRKETDELQAALQRLERV